MELAFNTQSLRDTCEDAELASSQFGGEVAADLRRRLADLRAATSVRDLVAGNPRVMVDKFLIDIGRSYVLELVPNHVKNPVMPDKRTDWGRVTRVRVLEVRLAES